jgi:hypothetical protein
VDTAAKHWHHSAAIDTYDKWVSLGIRQGFRDKVKKIGPGFGIFNFKTNDGALGAQGDREQTAHRIFLTLLAESVQQLLKLHRRIDCQLLRYRTVLGTLCDEGNWILSCQFAESVFAGTWRASLR